MKKMVQGKDTLNKNQSLPCQSWWHGPLLFLHQFLRFVLLLLLNYSGKLAIPRYYMFLLLQILRLFLFKSLQRQGDLRISGDSCVVFWGLKMAIGAYNSGGELIYHLFGTNFWDLFSSYFWPSVSKSFPRCDTKIRQGLRHYRWQVKIFWDIELCHWPLRWSAMLI